MAHSHLNVFVIIVCTVYLFLECWNTTHCIDVALITMLTPTGSAQQPVNGIDERSGDVGTLKTIKDTAADYLKEKSRQLTLTNFLRAAGVRLNFPAFMRIRD